MAASAANNATWISSPRMRERWKSGTLGGPLSTPMVMIDSRVLASAHGRRVHDAALGPQGVQPTRNLERRALPDIALEHLAVVADVLEDAIAPVLGEAELLAECILRAEQTANVGILGLELLVDIRLGDVELLGIDHGEVHPLDDVEPLVVAVAHERRERLLRDDLRQHDVVLGLGELEPHAV